MTALIKLAAFVLRLHNKLSERLLRVWLIALFDACNIELYYVYVKGMAHYRSLLSFQIQCFQEKGCGGKAMNH